MRAAAINPGDGFSVQMQDGKFSAIAGEKSPSGAKGGASADKAAVPAKPAASSTRKGGMKPSGGEQGNLF